MSDAKILSTKTAFTSKHFSVHKKTIERNGQTFTKDIVERIPRVFILPYTEKGEVYIELQYRDALEKEVLELVAGHIDPQEDPLVAAKRELLEETGLTAKQWKRVAVWNQSPNELSTIYVFFATELAEGEAHLDAEEQIETKKLPLTEILEKIEKGELDTAIHIAVILMFDRLMREGKL